MNYIRATILVLIGLVLGWLVRGIGLADMTLVEVPIPDWSDRESVSKNVIHHEKSDAPNWCRGNHGNAGASCRPPVFKDITEIILVVQDLDASVKKQWEMFGIGPWDIWTFDETNVKGMVQHDENKPFSIKIAYTKIGNIHWELVQPLDQHSTYYETLRDHGEGVHNIVFDVENYQKTIDHMKSINVGVHNAGNWQGTEFLNFNTRPHLPVIAEIFKYPESGSFPPPDEIYPKSIE